MPHVAFDKLRALAIGSQAVGLAIIITLETYLHDAARPWQGAVFAAMLLSALTIALVRLYRRNLSRKRWAEHVKDENET